MRIYFRADGSYRLGLGHIMRCLALAGELTDMGFEISFISTVDERGLKLIEFNQYHCHVLSEGLDEEEQLSQTGLIIDKEPFPVIITDLYFKGEEYFDSLRKISKHLIMISDHDHFPMPSHMVVNANLFCQGNAFTSKYGDTKFLAGPEYFLLDPAYGEYHRRPKLISERLEKIIVSFGGSDMAGLTLTVLDLIKDVDADIRVIVGGLAKNLDAIKQSAADNPRINVHHNISPEEMAGILYESDLMITAGGITSFQSACVGTPMMIICQVENQLKNATELQNAGAAITFGTGDKLNKELFLDELQKLENRETRSRMSRACKKVCSGSGAHRVALSIREQLISSGNAVTGVA